MRIKDLDVAPTGDEPREERKIERRIRFDHQLTDGAPAGTHRRRHVEQTEPRLDAQVANIDKAARRVSLSVKALEMAEEKEAIEKFGASDSGASLGDILGAALREKAQKD